MRAFFIPNSDEPEPNRLSLPDLLRICMELLGNWENWNTGILG
jgi:hypothetical protein